jgi:hypothetical protein
MVGCWLLMTVSTLLTSVVGAAGGTPERLKVGTIGLDGRTR